MKKIGKKVLVLVLAVVMVMAMSITAFAAAPGTYEVILKTSEGKDIPHDNPFTGADVQYDSSTGKTTIIVYAKAITYLGFTGYVSSLTLKDVPTDNGTEDITGTATNNSDDYPESFKFVLKGDYTSKIPITFNISYTVAIVIGVTTHKSTTGQLTIQARSSAN